MSLPPVQQADLKTTLEIWRQRLRPFMESPPPPRAPSTLTAESRADGILLRWSTVPGADGYEISASTTADFSDARSVILRGQRQDAYFDQAGVLTPIRHYYRVRATAGTPRSPQSVLGPPSAIVSAEMKPLDLDAVSDGTTYGRVLNTALYQHGLRPLHMALRVMAKRISSQLWVSGTGSAFASGWEMVGTSIVDVPPGVNSVILQVGAIGIGPPTNVTIIPTGMVGFSISSGSPPATPQATAANGFLATLSGPVTGTGLTLAVYIEWEQIPEPEEGFLNYNVQAISDLYQLMHQSGLT